MSFSSSSMPVLREDPPPDLKLVGSADALAEQKHLAEQAREWLLYAVQEGTPSDVRDYYRSLDPPKLIAFIRNERLDELPDPLIREMMEDGRHEIRSLLAQKKSLLEHPLFFSMGDYVQKYGFSKEEVRARGRETVLKLLREAEKRRKDGNPDWLNKDEVRAAKNMAAHIPDREIAGILSRFAEDYPAVGVALFENPLLASAKVEGVDPKDKAETTRAIMEMLFAISERNINRHTAERNFGWHSLMRAVCLYGDRNPEYREFLEKGIALAQKDPQMAEIFFSSEFSQDTCRQMFSIGWIKSVIKEKKWEGLLKKLWKERFTLGLTNPTVKILETHPDIPKFFYDRR
ncbi:hypothetical protein JXA05_04675 [Candidatus Peregrinibacteria bacterium]|nr:hypothetical protein [Candidatus Peregrinibacteria bacterium]